MRIGLISDTHLPEAGKVLPPQVAKVFRDVDLILHGGDLHILDVLDALEKMAPVLCARGNGDMWLPEDHRLNDTQVVTVDGLRIGLCHGLALPEEPPWRTLEKLMNRDFGGPVDIVVHGDTHVECVEYFKRTLLVNPGSPTLPHNLTGRLGTVGLLHIVDGKAEVRIVDLRYV